MAASPRNSPSNYNDENSYKLTLSAEDINETLNDAHEMFLSLSAEDINETLQNAHKMFTNAQNFEIIVVSSGAPTPTQENQDS